MSTKETVTSYERLCELVPSWLGRDYAVDTETSGLDHQTNRLLGVSITFGDTEESFYICFEHTVEYWDGTVKEVSFIDREAGMAILNSVLSQEERFVAAFNADFELHQFRKYNVRIQGRLFDGLLCAQLLDENRRNGLKSLAPMVGMRYDKYQDRQAYAGYNKREILGVPLPEVADYAMDDSIATWRLSQRFKDEIAGTSFEDTFYNVWMPLMFTIHDMEWRGIKVDREKAKLLLIEHEANAEAFENDVRSEGLRMLASLEPESIAPLYWQVATPEQLVESFEADDGYLKVKVHGVSLPLLTYEMMGKTKKWATRIPTFNTGSDKQLIELFYTHLKLADRDLPFELKRTPTGELSVDKDNIQTLIYSYAENPPKVLTSLLEWRKSEKFCNTYLKMLIETPDKDDRIHASFNQAVSDHGDGGTATGRLSSSRPNLQNIPSRGNIGEQARTLFIAPDGYQLLVSDYENLELRILGHFSRDTALTTAFEKGLDLHSMTAANQNNIDYQTFMDEVDNDNTAYKAMRRVGKVSNFGLAYGMGAKKFQRYLLVEADTYVTEGEAVKLIQGYNDTFAESLVWKKRVYEYAKQLGYVRTLAGRHRRLPNLHSRDRYEVLKAERQAVNAIIQGSAADVIMEAMPPLHRALNAIGGGILLQVHDEIVTEVPTEYADIGIKIMDSLMVDMANKKLRVPLSAHAHAAHNWGSAKG